MVRQYIGLFFVVGLSIKLTKCLCVTKHLTKYICRFLWLFWSIIFYSSDLDWGLLHIKSFNSIFRESLQFILFLFFLSEGFSDWLSHHQYTACLPALDDALLFPGMTHLLGCSESRATGQRHGEREPEDRLRRIGRGGCWGEKAADSLWWWWWC